MFNSKATPKKHTDSNGMSNYSTNNNSSKNKVGAYSTSYYDDEYDLDDEEDEFDDSDYNDYE